VTQSSFVDIRVNGRTLDIEYQWLHSAADAARPPRQQGPLVVFLHEGLGSLAMWKDYPQRLCDAGGYAGLVFSRAGYGRSTPRAPGERWPVTFMHAEAEQALPRLLGRLGVGGKGGLPWLFGHSDGASIALIHASLFPDAVAGVIAVAPHVFVEELSIRSIEKARDAYLATDLKSRLGRYHRDPDSAFWGWNDAWLAPEFRMWSIESMLEAVRCPILAVQGKDDEYGTLAQVDGIERRAPRTERVVLANCGHSPHRDAPDALTRATTDFISRHSKALTCQGGVQ
jgi:pimeloyl-ACP methyl ester carboxylesterase